MPKMKNWVNAFRNSHLQIAGILLLLFLALLLLWYNNATSNQALSAIVAQVSFDGESVMLPKVCKNMPVVIVGSIKNDSHNYYKTDRLLG